MFPRSLILLASAGAAIAQVAPECEHVADVAALLQADDGKAYCSAILDVGTSTETVVESATATETTTVTVPSQITLSLTTTQTDTVSSGTVTETAPTATATETVFESTTVYSCTTALKRRGYEEAQSTSCTKGKTTSTPTPSSTSCTKSKTSSTPTPVVTSTSCTKSKGQQHATSVAYGAGQPAYSQGVYSSAQDGYYGSDASKAAYPSQPAEGGSYAPGNSQAAYPSQPAKDGHSHDDHSHDGHSHDGHSHDGYSNDGYSAPLYTDSGAKGYPSVPTGYYHNASSAAYPASTAGASSVYYDSYPEESSAAYEAYPVTSSIYEQISSSFGYPTASSYYSSLIISSSEIYTPSPTPTPVPSCEAAPTAVQTGYACDAIYTACGCLGLTSATTQVTTTTTLTDAAYVTEAMLLTTTTQLTETVFTTVPAATETVTPSVTVTTTATATATVCPCSGATSTLCGTTPDTCFDLQLDTNNCGACGNVCGSGQECNAGKCITPAIPEVKACAESKCSKYIQCGTDSNCLCVATAGGRGVCAKGSTSCANPKCTKDSDCATDELCAVNTCCGAGICVKPADVCGNTSSAAMMFRVRRAVNGQTLGGM